MGLKIIVVFFVCSFVLGTAKAQVVNIEDRRTEFKDSSGMYERLDLGFNFIKNDKEVISVVGDFQIEFLQNDRLFLSLTKLALLKAGDESFINSGLQHLRYSYRWSDLFIWEAFGQIQYNEQLSISLRGLVGSGPRLSLDIGKGSSINMGLSYMWEYDEISGTKEIHHDSRLNSYISANFKILPVILSTTAYYQPLFNSIKDYRLTNQTTLSIQLHKKWSLKVAFNLNYDSHLPDNVPDLVYSITNGVRYRF